MGKIEKIKKLKKSTIIYLVTIVALFAISLGFIIAFALEKNKIDSNQEDETIQTTTTTSGTGSTTTTSGTGSTSPTPPPDLLLPQSVRPTHYDLNVEPKHDINQFEGRVTIYLNINESTNVINIHSYLLTITNESVTDLNGDPLSISNTYYNEQKQFHVIELSNPLPVGNDYQLSLNFNGSLVGKIIGFYKSQYINSDNQIREFSATKFEPTYARQAFPCFDEPNMKATYSISIIHDKNLNAISNGIQIDQRVVDENKVETIFSKTVPMSTYLVAYVISDFQNTNTSTTRGKLVRVFSRPDQLEKTRYALLTAVKILQYFENYYGIDYPLEKLDLVALPVFVSGAMENWGLITFRETNLLYSEQESSTNEMKRVAAVVSHELAHMWFGNLVTMDWWDDLWLNEGFASYIEYIGQNSSEPDWHIEQFFLNDDMQGVMRLDALKSSHPIIQEVTNPDQITEIFDSISYSKGAAVLRMLEFAIGTDVYRDGVRAYLEKYSYKNAKTQDLWTEINTVLENQLGMTVSQLMDPWTKVMGYPVVNITRVSANQILITQQRFLINPEEEKDSTLWPIHLTYFSANVSGYNLIRGDSNSDTIQLQDDIPLDMWIKFNDEESGFYLVNYQESDWKLLINVLKTNREVLSPMNRANIIYDASLLAESGYISYDILFDALSYIKDEDNLIPWMAAQSALNRLKDKLSESNGGISMKEYIKELTQSIYNRLGWEYMEGDSESFQDKLLRGRIISLACDNGNQECLAESLRLFKNWISAGQQISPDIREYAMKYGMQSSGEAEEWNRLWALYTTEVSASEKSKLLSALTSVSDTQLLQKLIAYTTDSSIINDQDFFTVQQSIAGNSLIGRQLIWNYLRNNWQYLVDRFTVTDRRLGTYVSSVCSGFATETQLTEMQDFFKANPDSGAGENARNQALENVKNNIKWREGHENNVTNWLDNNSLSNNPWLNWRLDSQVMPLKYTIEWVVDLTNDVFSGSVNIEVNITKPINYFILHIQWLEITKSEVYTNATNQLISGKNSSFAYTPNQFWIIPTNDTIRPNIYRLYLEFNGNLTNSLYGLYKSVYINTNSESKSLATTQFESTYARRAFPCFDEPQFKAYFDISVTHSSDLNALSNMPISGTQINDKITTYFRESVKMTTYLVALVVSDFVCVESEADYRLSICSAPDFRQKMNYSLDVGPKILNFFEKEYFEISYPLPKVDMIAIPDFSAGAMENWGLVTYREAYLLFDESESTTADLMRICSIISHELAHMWFGNLVTMKWWDDLWLNEGFATFMTYKAVSFVERDWNYNDYFAIGELNRVFESDSTPQTHPILTAVENADDISAVFDAITYAKGASVLRMLETALGEENFRNGIKNYLNKYAYQNTLTQDLWTELTNTHPDRLNVSQIMDTWISRKGFPVLILTRASGSNTVNVRQELFLKDFTTTSSSYNWRIPLTYKSVKDQNIYTEWIDDSQKDIQLQTTSDLIKFNVDQTGVFIVNYPTSDWNKWINELNDNTSDVINQLTPMDRSELINDAFYLARAGRLSYNIALGLSKYLSREQSLIPWTTAKNMFDYIKIFIYTDSELAINQYITQLVENQYLRLGWDDSGDANTKRLRTVIIDMACGYGMEDCLNKAAENFANFKTGSEIAPNLLSLVLRYGIIQSTNSDDFYYLLGRYNTTQNTILKLQYLQGLTSTTNATLLNELLQNANNEQFVRSQDFFTLLTYVARNPNGLTLVWDYFRDNYEEIERRFTINNSNLGRIVYTISTYFTTEAQKQEVYDFFKKYPNSGAGKLDREKAAELLDTNINWINRYQNNVVEWVTNQCPVSVCVWNQYRLTRNVIPNEYNLTIQINTTTNLFNGSVDINVTSLNETEYIIVHAADILTVGDTRVYEIHTYHEIPVIKTFRYLPYEFWVIRLGQTIRPNDYTISINFENSLLSGGLVGLYKSFYTDFDNKTIELAATQFESTHARKAFPCFDEPSFRSYFDITIIHDNEKNLTLSNMPISEEVSDSPSVGLTTTKYDRSVPMVTYLVAILVSDFACLVDNNTANLGIDIRICSSRITYHKAEYALEMTPKIFKLFDELLDSPYQLKKSDLVAIPHFSAGAMENWGLVKFRETALLWTIEDNTSASKMSVVSIIAHELAHMWFGNLATCRWWSDLWLNEGFASYMEYPAVAYSEPNWNYWDLFVFYDLSSAVSSDSSANSAPIVRQILTPSAMSYSSAIVYNKGATVIRMLEFAMGKEYFRNGIQLYLKQNNYSTVITENLWASLGQAFPENLDTNITELMDAWTTKAGFPYINITRNPDNSLTITQERFIANGQKPPQDTLWTIPLSYYTSLNQNRTYEIQFIKTKRQTINVNSSQLPNGMIKFNVDYTGMYFVNYPLEDWDKWIYALGNDTGNAIIKELTPQDRAEFILDSFYLSRAGMLPFFKPFELSRYLVRENHFTPWAMFNSMFSTIRRYMSMTEYKESLDRYLRYLTAQQFKNLNLDDSVGNHVTKRLRSLIAEISCESGYPVCLDEAQEHFQEWKQGDHLAPNLVMVILKYGFRRSSMPDDYDLLWSKYLNPENQDMKAMYWNAIAYSKNISQLQDLLTRSLDDRLVPTSDFVTLIGNLAANPEGRQLIWDFYKDNYDMLTRKLSSSQIGSVLSTICGYFSDSVKRKEVVDFLALYSNVGVTNSSRQSALNTIDSNINWMNQYKNSIGQWLATNGCGSQLCPWSIYRLNPKIIPLKYKPIIQVNVTTNVYNGSIFIDVNATEDVDHFIVHASSILNITSAKVLGPLNQTLEIEMTFRYTPYDFFVIELVQTLDAGIYHLEFEFNGNLLLGGLSGLYRSNYNMNNQSVGLAATQFEFIDARKAFPCFDEPSFKSTFEITLIHDLHMNETLSNMPIIEESTDTSVNWVTTKYGETPPMVTYLIAIAVTDFIYKESELDGKTFRVYASPVQSHKMDYALEMTKSCFHHLEKVYLQVDQPLTKVDMIAIPDFAYGAMENWGLVTFRETALLFHEDEETSANKMSITSVIAHELAHFWFGNIVTCQWWSNIWLNEGFATYMEYTAVNASEPDWDFFELFMIYDYGSAVSADSSATSHPLVRTVVNPLQVEQYTSNIVYAKGATVIRMLEHVMTPEKFQTGIQGYLRDNFYSTAITQNLLDSLSYEFPSDLDTNIYELMDSWTTKAGFPYINITRNGNTFTITQERFLANGLKPAQDTLWAIPLSYYTSFDGTQGLQIIKDKTNTITIDTSQLPNGLIKFNADNKGMYFTNYPIEDWDNWINTLVNNENNIIDNLTPSDRGSFIIDSFYLSRAGFLPYVKPLQLSQYLRKEKHLTPWTLAINMFSLIQRYMLTTEYRDQLLQYFTNLAQPIYEELGWDESQDSDTTKRLRAIIIDFICGNYYQPCLESALQNYTNWRNGQKLRPNLLISTLRYAIRQSNNNEDWNYLWNKYLNETSASLKNTYLNALSYTRDPNLIKILLINALNPKLVRTQDVVTILNNIAGNADGLPIIWEFYKNNYLELVSKLSTTNLGNVLNTICGYFSNDIRKQEVQDFLNSNQNIGLSNSDRNRVIATINSNINWMNAHKDEIGNFLSCGSETCPWTTYRLNPNIIPLNYDITFHVNITENNFSGSVNIEVNANESTKYFVVHAATTLSITKTQVFQSSGQEIPNINTTRYTPLEFWVIELETPVEPNTYRLYLEFNSELNGNMVGLYRSNYYNKDLDQTIGLAATQFQATSARKAFPCFDEPSFRSTFEVKITHDPQLELTISNMPSTNNVTDPTTGYVTHTFNKTVDMVTYLLALVVSDFECKEAKDNNRYLLRVCASPVEQHKLDYSLDSAPKLLSHYEEYLDYDYQLPKVDFIAIPDFSAGAMENWGLITFRETAMLWNETESTSTNKMSVIAVIAHEIAHMWFGNMLTCKWWSDLWLNEAFASFMEYTAVNSAELNWNYWDLFMIFDYSSAVAADSSSTTNPIIRTVDTPSQMAYTSAIVYQKGSTVLRQLQYVMTDSQFKTGIRTYLKAYAYTTVVSKNLFDALNPYFPTGEFNGTIHEFMYSWTSEAGFPYLNITRESPDSSTLNIKQERFLANGQKPNIDTIWSVLLTYYSNFDTKTITRSFIKSKVQSIDINIDSSNNGLIKFNTDGMGLYLVNYPIEDWDKWITALVNNDNTIISKLTPSDRTNFIIDSFYLSRAGFLPYLKPLELSKYLKNENHLTPWTIAINMFEQLQRYILLTEYKSDLQLFLSGLAQPLYQSLGWDDSQGNDVEKRLRSIIVEFSCNNNYAPCLQTARLQYYEWRVNGYLPPNVLSTALRYAIREINSNDEWNNLWEAYISSTSSVLKLTYLNALSYTTNPDLIKVLLDRSLDESLVRRQDYLSVLNNVIANPDGLQIMWDYYRDNYTLLSEKLSVGQLGTLINNMCAYFSNDIRKKEVEDFFSIYPIVGVTSSERQRALETINSNINWMNNYREQVGNWLKTETLKSIGSEYMNKWSKYKNKSK